jgi:deoxyadenosine/deoxycytidine kinase
MASYIIDYTYDIYALSVKPIKDKYQVINATIGGANVSQMSLSKMLYHAMATANTSTSDDAEGTNTTPKKSPRKATYNPPYSPVSVTSMDNYDDVLYMHHDRNTISKLKDILFSSPKTMETLNTKTEEHYPILLSIEGNIGAGKSTLLKELKRLHPEWVFIDEPLGTWTSLINDDGQNLLEAFYGNQDRWAYTFQNCSVLSRYQNIEEAIKVGSKKYSGKTVYVTERCLETDYHVFTKMLRSDKKLDAIEYALYEKWFSELKGQSTPLGGIVYVDTCPVTCVDRIKGRNREGEEGIPLTYLEMLDEFQSRWLDDIDLPIVRTCTVEGVEKFVNEVLSVTKI